MTTPIAPAFNEIIELNEQATENLYIEPAIMVIDNEGYCPGIQLEAEGFHFPIFISVEQLREMADNAEQIALEMVTGSKKEPKPNKKKKN